MDHTYQTVLVTEDTGLVDRFAEPLESHGFVLMRAGSVAEVVALAEERTIDLVLFDQDIFEDEIEGYVDRFRHVEKRARIVVLMRDDAYDWPMVLQALPIHACCDVNDSAEKVLLCAMAVVKNLPKIDLIATQFGKIKNQIKLSEKNKEGLRYIISAMPESISSLQPIDTFVRGILIQMCGFLNADDSFLATKDENGKLIILVGTGKFDLDEKGFLNASFHTERAQEIEKALERQEETSTPHCMLIPLVSKDEVEGIFYLEKPHAEIEQLEEDMMRLFASQVSITIENSNLFRMATQDGLTGLFVRRYFFERLQETFQYASRMGGHPVTFLISDIDHFKSVNDTYGHPMGDKVLIDVAKKMKESVRGTDVVGRIGGEEFAIILVNTGVDEAVRIANNLREQVKGLSFNHEGTEFSCSISVGVATFDPYIIDKDAIAGDDIDAYLLNDQKRIVAAADGALYYSKEHGRDQVTVGEIE